MISIATLNSFAELVRDHARPVVAVFCASSCRLCDTANPVVEHFDTEFAGRVEFVRVDMDETPKLKTLYNITVRPTMILFVGGEEIERFTGAPNGIAIREALEKVTDAPPTAVS